MMTFVLLHGSTFRFRAEKIEFYSSRMGEQMFGPAKETENLIQ